MNKPAVVELEGALDEARAACAETKHFTLNGREYRATVLPDEPPLAWTVWVSDDGDIVVDKRAAKGLCRPAQSVNDGYLMVSIRRADARAEDSFLRRRVHEWVAHAFLGPPPHSSSIVEHINDLPGDNRALNLRWSSHATNRAQRTANKGGSSTGKVRKVPISLSLIRQLQVLTGLRGRALVERIEQAIAAEVERHSTE